MMGEIRRGDMKREGKLTLLTRTIVEDNNGTLWNL